MIKAEDLRIGDLVRVSKTGCKIPKGTVCRVTAIETESMLFDDRYVSVRLIPIDPKCKQISWYDWCKNIDPIPLTPEILEKNGWERDKLVPYIYGHEAHYIEVICTPNSEWMYVTFKGETIHRIKYVHELQHILWALGLDANLKI